MKTIPILNLPSGINAWGEDKDHPDLIEAKVVLEKVANLWEEIFVLQEGLPEGFNIEILTVKEDAS